MKNLPRILVIDIGGNNVKLLASGEKGTPKISFGTTTYTAKDGARS